MSGVVLTAATAQVTPTAETDPVLKPLLPGPPTTRREFYNVDTIALTPRSTTTSRARRRTPSTSRRACSRTAAGGLQVGRPQNSKDLQAAKGERVRLFGADAAQGHGARTLRAAGSRRRSRLKDAETAVPRRAVHHRGRCQTPFAVRRVTDASPREAGLAPGLLPSRAALLAWAGAWLSGLAMLILDTRDPFVQICTPLMPSSCSAA